MKKKGNLYSTNKKRKVIWQNTALWSLKVEWVCVKHYPQAQIFVPLFGYSANTYRCRRVGKAYPPLTSKLSAMNFSSKNVSTENKKWYPQKSCCDYEVKNWVKAVFCVRSVKLASPKLFRALNFTTLNFSSYAIWLFLMWQLLQYHTKLLSQYFGMVLKQLPCQNKSNSMGRKIQGDEIQGLK